MVGLLDQAVQEKSLTKEKRQKNIQAMRRKILFRLVIATKQYTQSQNMMLYEVQTSKQKKRELL